MPVKLKEHVIREFTRPDRYLLDRAGDFDTMTGLFRDPQRQGLQRAPAFSSHIQFPSDFTDARAAYYDEVNGRIVFVGEKESVGDMAYIELSNDWTWYGGGAINVLTTATNNVGGFFGRNAVWRGGALYIIGQDSNVYGVSPTAGLSVMYSNNDARLLVPAGGRVFLITGGGNIYRLNQTNNGFYLYLNPVANLDVLYAVALKYYIALLCDDGNSQFTIYYVPTQNANVLQAIARINVGGSWTSHAAVYNQSNLFAVHNDELYFCSFDYQSRDAGQSIDVYSFNGSSIRHRAHVPSTGAAHRGTVAGLCSWLGELILYECSTGSSQTQTFRVLTGDGFTTLTTQTADASTITPFVWSLTDELILLADPSSNEGLYHANRSALVDGSVQTSRMDFGHPGREKRLERLTVLLDGHASNFWVKIKYRVNDATSWTQILNSQNSRQISLGSLGVDFYTLQIRVELDDDTGNNEDFRITAISAIYTEPE